MINFNETFIGEDSTQTEILVKFSKEYISIFTETQIYDIIYI